MQVSGQEPRTVVGQERERPQDADNLDEWATVDSSPEDVISGSDRTSEASRTSVTYAESPTKGPVDNAQSNASSSPVSGAGERNPTGPEAAAVDDTKEKLAGKTPVGERVSESSDQAVSQACTNVHHGTELANVPVVDQRCVAADVRNDPEPSPQSHQGYEPAQYEGAAAPPLPGLEGMSREDIAPVTEPIVESPKARNWGWGWGAVSGALKEVSAGVARDVRELKESFQAAIQVDSEDEEEGEDERIAAAASGGSAQAGPPEESDGIPLAHRAGAEAFAGTEGDFERGLKVGAALGRTSQRGSGRRRGALQPFCGLSGGIAGPGGLGDERSLAAAPLGMLREGRSRSPA